MGDVDEVKPKPSKGMAKKERVQSAKVLAKVLPTEEPVEQQVLFAENLISDQTEAKRRFSKRLQKKREDEEARQGPGSGSNEGTSERFVQDQIIIAPEIMSLILVELDFRSLKRVRLVCKSWLQAAQPHLERRAIVRFKIEDYPERIKSFKEIRRSQVLGTLPQPFHALAVDLGIWDEYLPYKPVLKQLRGLCPPLVITRFTPGEVPLTLALPLIIKSSSSLEYLKLSAQKYETGFLPLMDPAQNFPKLRHVNTKTAPFMQDTKLQEFHFPSIVAWIVNSSPKLETFKLELEYYNKNKKLGSQVLLEADIKNVKRLKIKDISLTSAAAKHFLSIPFSQLQDLHLEFDPIDGAVGQNMDLLLATVAKCTATLRVLNLGDVDPEALAGYPVCPNVEQLTMDAIGGLISSRFPSLQVLNFDGDGVNVLGDAWRDMSPFLFLKTLRAECDIFLSSREDPELLLLFFEKFPALERLRVYYSFVQRCWRQELIDNPRFMKMLEGIKHLEMHGYDHRWFEGAPDPFASQTTVAIFKGVQVITLMRSNEHLPRIPFQELPLLKVVQFRWGACRDLDTLLEVAGRVEKVVITNCCADLNRDGMDRESMDLLNLFFDAAPNAECGCKDQKTIPRWWL